MTIMILSFSNTCATTKSAFTKPFEWLSIELGNPANVGTVRIKSSKTSISERYLGMIRTYNESCDEAS